MQWWEKDPAALARLKLEVAEFENLEVQVAEGRVQIVGSWAVFGEKNVIDRFQIQIDVPADYPASVPKVYETAGVLSKTPDDHFNPDSSACLLADPERFEKWPVGAGIREFLNGPVREFFFSQAFRNLTGDWPFGESSHGDIGILEYYASRFNDESAAAIRDLLKVSLSDQVHRQWRCPCGSKRRLIKCHYSAVLKLKEKVPAAERKKGLDMAEAAITQGLRSVRLLR